jgi:NAD(P)-dependent dehydrogenase (short-subunit alcohol dehydrogenase family)
LYATVKQQKGQIDILFANAVIGEFSPLEKISEQHFDKTFDVNVKGVLFTVQKALPLFKEGGSIILSSSTNATKAMNGTTVYSASKAAVRSFARTWTLELKQRKIRVNAISPGPIDTPGLSAGFSALGVSEEQIKTNLSATIPLGRMDAHQ